MKFFAVLLILRNGKILAERKCGKYSIPMEEYHQENKILLGAALRLLERKIGINARCVRFVKQLKRKNEILRIYHVEEYRTMKLGENFCFVNLEEVDDKLVSQLELTKLGKNIKK